MYRKTLFAGWGDMDFNSHMRNTAFLDKVADVRMLFFAEQGFAMQDFIKLRVGPIAQKDEVVYYREIHLLQSFDVTLAVAGISEDSSKFRFYSEFYLADGQLAATVTSNCGWLHLDRRKLVAPPAEIQKVFALIPRTDNCEALKSSVKVTEASSVTDAG